MSKFLDYEGLKVFSKKVREGLSEKLGKTDLLDDEGRVRSSVLPSYVDDVMEFTGLVDSATMTALTSGYVRTGIVFNKATGKFIGQFRKSGSTMGSPVYSETLQPIVLDGSGDDISGINAPGATPETGKIYVDIKANKSYRWSGSQLVEISGGVSLGETSTTAYAGDKGAKNASDIARNTSDIEKILTGDLPVAVPKISKSSVLSLWEVTDSEGGSVTSENGTNLTTTYGMKVTFNGCYSWTGGDGYKAPTAVAGGNWTDLPKAMVTSSVVSVGDIVTDRTFSVKLSAPAQGLVYVNGKIREASASDLDYSSASASVHFRYKTVFGSVDSQTVSAETLQGLLSSGFELADNRKKAVTGVTTASDKHLMFAYPALLGELTKIVMNDAVPLLSDGFTLSKLSVKDPVTKATLEYNVYTSVQKGAFTNAKLDMA